MSNEGAKKARNEINKFHKCLNSPALLPLQVYTPSQIGANTVLWVNQIIALMISHNYNRIPFCIARAFGGLEGLKNKPVFNAYSKVARDYLCQVSYFLKNYSDLEEKIEEIIPKEIYIAGSKSPPEYSMQTQNFEGV